MKKVYILIFCISATFVSCTKKCYHCDNGVGGQYHSEMEVCSGDPQYEYIEDGVVYTDNLGNPYHCER